MTETATIGTLLGTIEAGETLAGWEIIATGDGGAITMKSGSCWGRYGGWAGDADTAWAALTARLWDRLTDEELLAKLRETRAEAAAAKKGTMAARGAQAAYEATYSQAAARRLLSAEWSG